MGLIGAVTGLALGLVLQATLQRFVYPLLRNRHERAKVTASHGRDPSQFMALARIVNLLALPVIGFLIAQP